METHTVTHEKLLNLSPAVMCVLDEEGRFLFVNTAATRVFGCDPHELTGRCCHEFSASCGADSMLRTLRMSKENGTGRFTSHCPCSTGSTRSLRWSVRWDDGDRVFYALVHETSESLKATETWANHVRHLQRAYDLAEIGWWELDLYSQTITCSTEVFCIFGRPVTPGNKTSVAAFLSYVHPEDVDRVRASLSKPSGNNSSRYEYRILRPSGEVVYLNNSYEALWDDEGKQVGFSGIIKNVTGHVLRNRELLASKKVIQNYSDRLAQILETIGDGFFVVGADWKITYWNKKLEEISGVQRHNVLGTILWDGFPAKADHSLFKGCRTALARREGLSTEDFYPALNFWLEANIYVNGDELLVYLKDISERKRQESRVAFMAKATAEVIWERVVGANHTEVDRMKFQKLFGYSLSKNTLTRDFWLNHIHPEDQPHVFLEHDLAFRNGDVHYVQEYRFKKADGNWAHVRERTHIVRSETGETALMIGAMEDVTAQRTAEIRLLESEQSYRQLFDNAPLPMLISDAETLQYLDVNHAAVQELGYSKDEFLKKHIWDIRPHQEYDHAVNHFRGVRDERPTGLEQFVYLPKDGRTMLADVAVSLINYKGKKAFLATLKDVTQMVQLQAQLTEEKVRQQKAITIATIEAQENERSEIGKELHDNVNQILATASLYISSIRSQPDMRDYFIEKGAELLEHAVGEIKRLSKTLVAPSLGKEGFRDAVLKLLRNYKELKLFEVTCILELDGWDVDKGIQIAIYRILQEALHNSVKYAKASAVEVEVRCTGDVVAFSYTDNGVGFDPATVHRNLGLNNMQNRAGAYGGQAVIASAPGRGFQLSALFPLHSSNTDERT